MSDPQYALFLDRDGTLNLDKNYAHRCDQFEWVPEVLEVLKYFKELGYLLIVISNQSGVARGYFSEETVRKFNHYLDTQLINEENIHIDGWYYCPHHPDGIKPVYRKNCRCRKPDVGLFEQAIYEHHLSPEHCMAVGDSPRDLIPAAKMNIPHYFLLTKTNTINTSALPPNTKIVKSWHEIMMWHKNHQQIVTHPDTGNL